MNDSIRRAATALLLAALAGGAGATLAQDAVEPQAAAPSEQLPTIPVDPTSYATSSEPTVAEAPEASDRNSMMAEIVVTAQKREESINDVPIAISAFSGDDLEALGVEDTRDLGNLVPGFSYADSGYTVPIYSLRGVGFNESSQTASSTVGIYVDEQNLAFPVYSKGANLDLSRVEVLKGPQGTLYGRNTTGGLVNYIANKPTDTLTAGFAGTYGSFELADVEGYVSGPVVETLRARLAYRVIRSGEGWQESLTRGEDGAFGRLGEQDKQAGRLTVDWLPGDAFTSSFTLSGWKDDSEPQAPQAIGFQPQNPVTGGLVGNLALTPEVAAHPLVPLDSDDNRVADWSPELPWHLNETFLMASNRSDWTLTDSNTLTFLVSYADFENDRALIPQSGLSVINTERELIVDSTAFSTELRVNGEFSEDVDWLVGGFLSRDEVYEYQSIFIETNSAAFPLPGVPVVSPAVGPLGADRVDTYGEQTADTYAFFGNLNWQFQPEFKLNLGARFTNERREFQGCSVDSPSATRGAGFAELLTVIALLRPATNPGSPPPTQFAQPGGCFTLDPETNNAGLYTGVLDESNVSGRVALDWTPNEDMLFYLSYSRGFKSGSFPVFPSSDQSQYEPITQEQLDAFEAGAKTAFFDSRLRANVSAFYYDYQDKQLVGRIVDAVFGPLQKLVNAPESEVRGIELELQGQPLRGLFLSASAIFIETEVKEFEGLDQSGDPVNLSGKPFNFSPEVEYALIADYVVPLTDTYEFGLGADYSYTDETNSVLTQDPLFVIHDYALLNARVSIASIGGGWKLTAFSRNLTDEFYSNGVFNTGDTVSRYAGMPRTYGLTLSMTWD